MSVCLFCLSSVLSTFLASLAHSRLIALPLNLFCICKWMNDINIHSFHIKNICLCLFVSSKNRIKFVFRFSFCRCCCCCCCLLVRLLCTLGYFREAGKWRRGAGGMRRVPNKACQTFVLVGCVTWLSSKGRSQRTPGQNYWHTISQSQ